MSNEKERRSDYISIKDYFTEIFGRIETKIEKIDTKLDSVIASDLVQDIEIKNIKETISNNHNSIKNIIRAHLDSHWKYVTLSLTFVGILLTIFKLIVK